MTLVNNIIAASRQVAVPGVWIDQLTSRKSRYFLVQGNATFDTDSLLASCMA